MPIELEPHAEAVEQLHGCRNPDQGDEEDEHQHGDPTHQLNVHSCGVLDNDIVGDSAEPGKQAQDNGDGIGR